MSPTHHLVAPLLAFLTVVSGVSCLCDLPKMAASIPHAHHHGLKEPPPCGEAECCADSCVARLTGVEVKPHAAAATLRVEVDLALLPSDESNVPHVTGRATGPPPPDVFRFEVSSTPVRRHDMSLE